MLDLIQKTLTSSDVSAMTKGEYEQECVRERRREEETKGSFACGFIDPLSLSFLQPTQNSLKRVTAEIDMGKERDSERDRIKGYITHIKFQAFITTTKSMAHPTKA